MFADFLLHSVTLQDVKGGKTAALNKVTDFSGFEHRWKHLAKCIYTSQLNIKQIYRLF